MKTTRNFTVLILLSLAWAWAGSPALAMPRAGAVPARSATPEDVLVPGEGIRGKAPAADPMDNLVIPDNVLRIDGVTWSGKTLKAYARHILEKPASNDNELLGFVDDMALDIAGYDAALREMPSLKDDIRVVQAVAKFKARILPSVYFNEKVRGKANPTVEDLLAKVPEPAAQYEVSVIVNSDEGKIDEAARAISEGQPFDAVARKYSEGMTAGKGGKVGSLFEGKYDLYTEAEFRVIKALKDGEVSKPFMSRIGWTILRLEKYWSPDALRRAEVERNYESYKAEAEKARFRELYREIESRSKVVWNDDNLERIRIAIDNNLPFTDELSSSEMFRVNGFPVYALEIESLSRFHSPQSLDIYLDRRLREELFAQEAERLGYAVQADALIDISRRRAVTRRFFQAKSRSFAPSGKDLAEYYEKNKEKFFSEERRGLLVIETPDRKKADEAYRKAKKGEDFRALAGSYAYKEEQREARGEVGFLTRSSLQPDVGDKIFGAREGAILGPFALKDPDGKTIYAVAKVEAIRKAALRPYDKVDKESLAGKVVAWRMEEFFKGFIGGVNREHKVEFLVGKGGGGK